MNLNGSLLNRLQRDLFYPWLSASSPSFVLPPVSPFVPPFVPPFAPSFSLLYFSFSMEVTPRSIETDGTGRMVGLIGQADEIDQMRLKMTGEGIGEVTCEGER